MPERLGFQIGRPLAEQLQTVGLAAFALNGVRLLLAFALLKTVAKGLTFFNE